MTTTRDDRKTASGIEWVTKTIVVPVRSQIRSTSEFIRSRVISSSAPNGSSMSRIAGSNDEGPGDRDALLHAARQLVGVVLRELAELDEVEHLARPRRPFRGRPAEDLERELDVVLDRPPLEQDGGLEHHAVVAVAAGPLGRLAVDDDLAPGRRDEVADHPEQRRLAAARRPDERDELAPGDVEIDALEGGRSPAGRRARTPCRRR